MSAIHIEQQYVGPNIYSQECCSKYKLLSSLFPPLPSNRYQDGIRTRNNIVRRKREWRVANAYALNDDAFNRSTRSRIFHAIQSRPFHWKRYTNVPKCIGELLLSLTEDGLQYTPYNAVVLPLTYLTNAMHYKTLANIPDGRQGDQTQR